MKLNEWLNVSVTVWRIPIKSVLIWLYGSSTQLAIRWGSRCPKRSSSDCKGCADQEQRQCTPWPFPVCSSTSWSSVGDMPCFFWTKQRKHCGKSFAHAGSPWVAGLPLDIEKDSSTIFGNQETCLLLLFCSVVAVMVVVATLLRQLQPLSLLLLFLNCWYLVSC